ncbi:MAG: hypothetical protein MZV64_29540 [Ignavibacteriales bacterium]|nr:hypothetical protein [Ignavibacteriales bacterium]
MWPSIGGEAALFSFDAAGFGRTYPGCDSPSAEARIPASLCRLEVHDVPRRRLYADALLATIGASKLTKAPVSGANWEVPRTTRSPAGSADRRRDVRCRSGREPHARGPAPRAGSSTLLNDPQRQSS